MSGNSHDVLSLGFSLSMPLLKAQEEMHHGEPIRFVSGFASLELEDQQRETVIQKGIDYQPLLDAGYINWDHGDIRKGTPDYLIGEPTHADIRTYQGVPGFYIEGYLYSDKKTADAVWEHLISTSKSQSKRRMGWSIQGQTLAASSGKILKSVVRDVALTHKPVLRETTVSFQEIAKSLSSRENSLYLPEQYLGHPLGKSATSGSLEAVRTEDLLGADRPGRRNPMRGKQLRAVMEAIYGPSETCKSNHYDERGRFRGGAVGALDHFVTCLEWPLEDAEPAVRLLREAFRD